MEALVCHVVSHSIPFSPHILTFNVDCNESLVLFVALASATHQYWIVFTGTCAALTLQDQLFPILQQFIDKVNGGMTNSKPWIWAWMVDEVVRPLASSFSPTLPD